IGECGLDALRGPDMALQREVFLKHIGLSEALGKPLLIHAVRCWPELIALRHNLNPAQEWIIHGFRGKAELAAELLRHGFSLSFGLKYNEDAFRLTPPERRYRETDTVS
ncbi:MAG: TatD family hydrolase, partial [Muribaculaceae bacterium]|nr:TatD family hydrolase [Muribaculaceae bacterium]